MIKGNIYLTSDESMIMNLSTTHTIICVSGDTANYQELIHATNANIASILLPPYEAAVAELDESVDAFKFKYTEYLSSKEPFTFMALILRAIHDGKNILLYVTPQEEKMNYVRVLHEYFQFYFGITIGTRDIPFSYNPAYIPTILNILYMNELLDGRTYLIEYPIEIPIQDQLIITKLANELNPYVTDVSINGYTNYFNDFKNTIKRRYNIISPFELGR